MRSQRAAATIGLAVSKCPTAARCRIILGSRIPSAELAGGPESLADTRGFLQHRLSTLGTTLALAVMHLSRMIAGGGAYVLTVSGYAALTEILRDAGLK